MVSEGFYGVLADGDESKFGGVPDDQEIACFGNIDRAVEVLDSMPAGARLYRLVPVSAAAHYDWGVLPSADDVHNEYPGRVTVYVHEQAARNCRGDGTLMRRRRGTDTWTEVTE